MEDSWQVIRIKKTLKGIPDEHTAREGLFDIIQKSKSHYQKRAYQCIKLLVALFSQCEVSDKKRNFENWTTEFGIYFFRPKKLPYAQETILGLQKYHIFN